MRWLGSSVNTRKIHDDADIRYWGPYFERQLVHNSKPRVQETVVPRNLSGFEGATEQVPYRSGSHQVGFGQLQLPAVAIKVQGYFERKVVHGSKKWWVETFDESSED